MIKWELEPQEIDAESTDPHIPVYKAAVEGGWLYVVFYPHYGPLLQFVPAGMLTITSTPPAPYIEIDPESPQFDFGFVGDRTITIPTGRVKANEVLQNTTV